MTAWVWYRKRPAEEGKANNPYPSIRLMAYAEGHVIVRYSGCAPFSMTLTQFLAEFQLDPPEVNP